MKKNKITLLAMALFCAIGVSACSDGDDGKDGAPGEPGIPGTPGVPGAPAGSTVDTVATAADFKLTVAPSDIVVVGTDDFSIKFTATGKNSKGDDVPFTGLDKVALYVTNQMANPTDSGAPLLWSNNALVNEFGSSMYCTPTGKATARGGAEVDACTLVEDPENPGTYTGTWEHDGNAPVVVADGDPTSMFRVMVRTYNVTDASGVGISDKLLSTPVDFIPATGELAMSAKDSVSNAACIQCHSELMGYGEGDQRIANIGAHHNYQKVENCVACHNPAYAADQNDPEKGFNPNFNAMIHTIHAGGHLAEWGVLKGEALEEFAGVHFPAELNQCTTCHDNGTQWNDNVYAEACVGCHVTVNFETGEGHKGIVPSSDAACSGCHGAGSLSPKIAHKVGNRVIEQDQVVLDFQDVTVTDNGDGTSALTVTTKVTINGAAPADGVMLDPYIDTAGKLLIGNVDSNGAPITGLGMSVKGVAITGGILTTTKSFDSTRLTGSIYVTGDMLVCAADGEAVECTEVNNPSKVSASAPVKYFNLDDSTVAAKEARMSDPARVTVTEAKCNSCHGSLTVPKEGHHGVSEFTQCMDCHNDKNPVTYYPNGMYQTGEVDADGKPITAPIEGVTFSHRDLMTATHRFHTGSYGGGIYLDKNLETVGYPALATDCEACHKDGATFFAADGGLTSGKRSIQVSATDYISPVAESCRSCHISASALAHFESNGATVQGTPAGTANLPVESCATCHAEGKTYGVDKVHAGGAH
ncbi:OmcA/MtrC family decaheme c-type cytochrome [Shewanella psychrotolerans]|uniref:OmcA/MtrC family decaheme c-type cytochrome n=1 Tax=Shewanella psychrotolerans TaxID=2864206 RepID=UPI001C6600EC|nr:OmcA/MtrC family decaheme c-type cytochrome [Shewanella psychrotolerans]QYK02191.1 OmcA/MtrC family decaheme c-type cytochrome [Shewanella psychrotolerans]